MGTTGYNIQPNALFWIKIKLCGKTPCLNRILEIAYVYTDLKLKEYHPGSHIIINCSQNQFKAYEDQEIKALKESGLYQDCLKSKINIKQAQRIVMNDFQTRNIARGQLLIAGKQIHLTKFALMQHMPRVHDYLHYRIFDLTSVQLVIEGHEVQKPTENSRVNEAVDEEIKQMQFYYDYALNDS